MTGEIVILAVALGLSLLTFGGLYMIMRGRHRGTSGPVIYPVLTGGAIMVTVVLLIGYTTYAVSTSQHDWCSTLQLLTARPVPRPTSPSSNPSREQSYIFYTDFLNLRRKLGC